MIAARSGAVQVECGRPARPLAWASVHDGALVVEVESLDEPGSDRELGRFGDAAEAARQLSAALDRDFRCSGAEPLFIALLDVG